MPTNNGRAPAHPALARGVLAALAIFAGASVARADELPAFLARHCIDCHGADHAENDVRLDVLKPARATSDQRERWLKVLEQLSLGTMPPEGEQRPPREEIEHAIDALRQALEIPDGTPGILDLPGFGNYVPHEALFTEPPVRRAASPARIWRINPYIFREAANAVSGKKLLVVKRNQGGEGLHPALPFMTPAHEFRDLALPHRFEEATTELLVDMAWLIAGYQKDDRRAPLEFRRLLARDEPRAKDYEPAIRYQFGFVLQRDASPDELEDLSALAVAAQRDAGPDETLQTVLAAILVMPESVFRFETGSGPPDEHGRVLLTPRELAFAISYALTDLPPDQQLRDAAARGRLATAAGVRSEVERLLHDPTIEKPRVLRFFREYFEYTRCTEIFKDGRIRKHYMPEQLVEDADFVVRRALEADQDVLGRLLTTSDYFINYGGDGKIGVNRPDRRQKWYYEVFNLDREWEWQSDQPIALPSQQRSGLLTHPAWLISFSDNEKNQAIQRGYWVRHKLLGGTVPDVPIGVDAQLPTDPHLTLREKMHVTREAYCWRCHQRMDPLGLPFEQFDDFGIFRTDELGRPVDTTGAIEIGDSRIDGPVDDPFEYMHRLATSDLVREVFVRHAFRYWMARNETLDDAPTLIDAERAYRESGGSMNALLASLLSSDSFLYRRAPADRTASAAESHRPTRRPTGPTDAGIPQ